MTDTRSSPGSDEWHRLNSAFHKALALYPDSHMALHFLWNNTVAGSRDVAQAAPEPVAWLYDMAHYIKPADENPYRDWRRVVTIDPPPTIPRDGVRNIVPLYASPPSPVAGEAAPKHFADAYTAARKMVPDWLADEIVCRNAGDDDATIHRVKSETDAELVRRIVATYLAVSSTYRPGPVEGAGLNPASDRKDQSLVEEGGSTPPLAATMSPADRESEA